MQDGKGIAEARIKCEFVQDFILGHKSTGTEEVSQNGDS